MVIQNIADSKGKALRMKAEGWEKADRAIRKRGDIINKNGTASSRRSSEE